MKRVGGCNMDLKPFLLVGLGGGVGSMARLAVAMLVGRVTTASFPVATFSINLVGSLVIGLLFGAASRTSNALRPETMMLLATGFCGGFTTFSTFALDNIQMLQKGQTLMPFIYSWSSVVLSMALCRVGVWMTS